MERLPFRFNASHVPFVIFVVLVLSACSIIGRGNDAGDGTAADGGANVPTIFGNQTPLDVGEAVLMCTQACIDRGFCGTLLDGGRVILMSTAGPTADEFNFNVFALDNSAVTITDRQTQNAYLRSDRNSTLTIDYYAITNAEIPQAWVAGWCVGRQQLPAQ